MNKQFAAGLPRVLRPWDGNPGVRKTDRWTEGRMDGGMAGEKENEGRERERQAGEEG